MNYVATYTLAQYNMIIVNRAIHLLQARLTHGAEHAAERIQQVEAAQSTKLAKWRCQEDAAIAKALANKGDMQCCHNGILCMINNEFAVELDSRRIMIPSNGTDDVSALLETK